jgi:hypothetical protein
MDFLQTFAVIAFFIGGRPPESQMQGWLGKLKEQAQGPLARGRNLGRGFFIIKADDQEVVKNLLLLTPFRSEQGLCVFQEWSPNFDLEDELGGASRGAKGGHQGFKIPTWITLRNVREEFMAVAQEIAAGIGEVLGVDESNDNIKDPRFCVGLSAGGGWEPSVVVTNSTTKKKHTILIDYNFLPIRCRACGDTQHCLKDCSQRNDSGRPRGRVNQPRGKDTRWGQRTGGQDPRNRHNHGESSRPEPPRRQPTVDEEGFQRLKTKHWRGSGNKAYQPGGPTGDQSPCPENQRSALNKPDCTQDTNGQTNIGSRQPSDPAKPPSGGQAPPTLAGIGTGNLGGATPH